jgi:LacI family transcriptional regulator
MATIYDVAKRARVSTYTVSAVINRSAYVSPELTERVKTAVRELDYTVNQLARGLQTRKTNTIGMLIPDIANAFYAKVVRGVEDRLRTGGYSLIFGSTHNDRAEQSRYLNVFRSKQVDGLLIFICAGDESEVEKLVKAKRPIVFVGRIPSTFEADTVTADNVKATRLAIEHLIAHGHRRIGLLTGQLAVSTSSERVKGWRAALKKHRIPAPDCYIGSGDWSRESAIQLAAQQLDLPEPPTAFFVSNAVMMTGVLATLRDRKLRCPEDVELMSSNDSAWLEVFHPPISAVVQPSYSMGDKAAELLLKRIRSPKRPFQRETLAPKLCIRSG